MAGISFSFRIDSTAVKASVRLGVARLWYANSCWTPLVKQLQKFCGDVRAKDKSFSGIDVYLPKEARAKLEQDELSQITKPKTRMLLVISTLVYSRIFQL